MKGKSVNKDEPWLRKALAGVDPEDGAVIWYSVDDECWYVACFDLDFTEKGATLIKAIREYERRTH